MGNEQPTNHIHLAAINRRRLLGALIAALLLTLFLLGRPFSALSDNTLFAPVADAPPIYVNNLEAAHRSRPARINWNALDPDADELHLNLFHDVNLTAELLRIDRPVTGGFVWVGSLDGETKGSVTLAVQNGVLSGSVYRFGREWATIRHAGEAADDLYIIIEVDPEAPQPMGQDSLIPQPSALEMQALSPQGATCQEDGTTITVMVVYTPAARDLAGGQAAVESLISQRISEMNTANDVSGVNFDWELTHVMEVDYAESGNIATDLQNLQVVGDGILDDVHAPRDTYKADLVTMLIDEGNNNACGYAYQMNSLGDWFQGFGFGVSALDYPGSLTCNSLTLAHEIGHNLGNAHNRSHSVGAVLFPYSYGYQSPNRTFRDIMSYDCPNGGCPRINQWANPDVWYMGEPTGVDYETDPANAADIARSMNGARVLASNFRADCVEPTPTNTPTATDVPLPTDTPTPSSTPPPTDTPTETLVPTDTPTPTLTTTPTQTLTPTVTPTGTFIPPTNTNTPQPTATTRPTRTPHSTATPEPSPPTTQLLYLPAIIRN